MSKSPALSGLMVLVVIVLVAGVAWFRSQPRESASADLESTAPVPVPQLPSPPPPQDALPAREQATPLQGNTSEPADTQPASLSDLLPEPVPVHVGGDVTSTTSAPASQPASQPLSLKRPRVVDLGARKCKACIALAPILEELRKEYAGRVDVDFIDVWKDPAAGGPYKIRMIPTQIFYDAVGKEIWRHEGFLSKADFIAKFKEVGVK